MPEPFDRIDQLCVNTIRTLSLDAVEQAKSGHPGLPLGTAPMAHALWSRHLRFNPADPAWPGRDRFVLSAGHGCMLLYSLLHLTGYDLPLDELKRFRQWGSRTPGHPEYGHTPGVEVTTGPLGQGISNSVGIAIAGKHLGARYGDPAGFRVFVIASDGDLMEGVSNEASSLAGHLALDNLVVLYDDNHVSIDGDTSLSFTEDRTARYDALGWRTRVVADGNDMEAVDAALAEAIAHRGQPCLIAVKTIIGFGSRDAGTSRAHSDARGAEQQAETKRNLDFDPDRFFFIPEEALARYREIGGRGAALQARWDTEVDGLADAEELRRIYAGRLPELDLPPFVPDEGPMATRAASGKVIAALAEQLPELVGGSADLTPSNNTKPPGSEDFEPGTPTGRYLRFGVREHGMGAVTNGLAVSGLRAYAGTFFNFLDYMKPAVRLSALMNVPAIWVYTHDSIGLGEDGPTHQPIEQLATLRATPNMTVFRPADANETAVGWRIALERPNPTALALTRQALPVLDPVTHPVADAVRGGYVLEGDDEPDVLLIATGSEVHLARGARELLAERGVTSRVVSLPSFELFEEQSESYRREVLPPAIEARVCIEAGASLGWDRYAGPRGALVTIDRFGASAPYTDVFANLGFTPGRVAEEALRVLSEIRDPSEGGITMTTRLHELAAAGTSPWLDNIRRSWLESGTFRQMVEEGVVGVTSNPTIFQKAIADSDDYDEAVDRLAASGASADEIFFELAIEDVQAAADQIRGVYDGTNHLDGFVSFELPPGMANDTDASIAAAPEFWRRIDRPNIFIKIPGTAEGIPAIEESIAAGINVNVTLLFSLERYEEIHWAFIRGLERRVEAGQAIDDMHSVASFFVSRVDTAVDALLPDDSPHRGTAAIANAKLAYQRYLEIVGGDRWRALEQHGARRQRPLWASTGTKNAAYSDVVYVDNLIGPETVNTMPDPTIEAFKDHGTVRRTVDDGLEEARASIAGLADAGVSLADVTHQLEVDGVRSFSESFDSLIDTIHGEMGTRGAA